MRDLVSKEREHPDTSRIRARLPDSINLYTRSSLAILRSLRSCSLDEYDNYWNWCSVNMYPNTSSRSRPRHHLGYTGLCRSCMTTRDDGVAGCRCFPHLQRTKRGHDDTYCCRLHFEVCTVRLASRDVGADRLQQLCMETGAVVALWHDGVTWAGASFQTCCERVT
ncbi:hypothetical protein BC629DRAFT_1486953 [Irpex lacteus]|nr:hypothetical protein BC629DRAFT_1486953 [Irpex lacteus]